MPSRENESSRRRFLGEVLTLAAAGALPAATRAADTTPPAATATAAEPESAALPPSYIYRSLDADEIVFVETLVGVLCPADELTPSGVDCGLAAFIVAQLAGAFGKGARSYLRGPWRTGKVELGYQLPLTPEDYFKTGIAAADRAACRLHQQRFAEMEPALADKFLQRLADGEIVEPDFDLRAWFNTLVYPLFVEACFADPVYGGNRDKIFWRLIGYPGLPAVYGRDIVTYRGQPHPAARAPKSMVEFS